MKREFISRLGALIAAMTVSGAAHAAAFDFSYSFQNAEAPGGFSSASGVFNATDEGDGTFLVTAASGMWEGEAITGISPVNSEGDNDNLLFPTSTPVLDYNGLAFTVAGPIAGDEGLGIVNVYSQSEGYTDYGESGFSPIFNLTPAVPEPNTWALMIVGLGSLGTVLRRRRTAVAFG